MSRPKRKTAWTSFETKGPDAVKQPEINNSKIQEIEAVETSIKEMAATNVQNVMNDEDKDTFIKRLLPQLLKEIQPILDETRQSLHNEMAELRRQLEEKDNIISDLRNQLTRFQSTPKGGNPQNIREQHVNNSHSKCEHAHDALEQYTRRNCLLIKKVPVSELDGISTDDFVINVARSLKVDIKPEDICRSHRLGKPRDGKVIIIVRFVRYNIRRALFSQRKHLKDTPLRLVIGESLTNHRRLIYKALDSMRYEKKLFRTWSYDGRIHFKFSEHSPIREFPVDEITIGANYPDVVSRMVLRWSAETPDQDSTIASAAAPVNESSITF